MRFGSSFTRKTSAEAYIFRIAYEAFGKKRRLWPTLLLSDGFSKYRLALTPRITPSRSRRFFSRRIALSIGSPLRNLISIVIGNGSISVCVSGQGGTKGQSFWPKVSPGWFGRAHDHTGPFTGSRVLHSLKQAGVKRMETLDPFQPPSRLPLPPGQSPVVSKSPLRHDPPRQTNPW